MLIYRIRNTANGKVYVGQTRGTVRNRLREHFEAARAGGACRIHQAIRKHGEESFTITVLEHDCDASTANALERMWIWYHSSTDYARGYNMSPGGFGVAEETREKLRLASTGANNPMYGKPGTCGHAGKSHTVESRNRVSQGRKGKGLWSPERRVAFKAKFSGSGNPFFGKKHSEKAKAKNRIAHSTDAAIARMLHAQKVGMERRDTSHGCT